MVVQFVHRVLKVVVTLEFLARIRGCAGNYRIIVAKPYKLASDGGDALLSLR